MKTLQVEIPEYFPTEGFKFSWEDDFILDIQVEDKTVYLRANEAGLISLARILLTLSQPAVMKNYHLHLDDSNSLEDGSTEIIIEKI